jgi:transcription antitermination factor NusG
MEPAILTPSPELRWFVAHSRPRCEKKLVHFCAEEEIKTVLPCYTTVHRYRGKTVQFRKPLFPGYVFLHMLGTVRNKVYQSKYVANLLNVVDQAQFIHQLEDILRALDSGVEVRLAPEIGEGTWVRIKNGPLRGMSGWVEKRYGMTTVLLRLDFIGQAAAVQLQADDLEPI